MLVIIDVFRAFTTACYVLAEHPSEYLLVETSSAAARLARGFDAPLMIGKPERGADLRYDIPNSPTRLLEVPVAGRCVIHRSDAGAHGVLAAPPEEVVLVTGFVNLSATALHIRQSGASSVQIIPMGHEGTTPSLEDNLCGDALRCALAGQSIGISQHLAEIRDGSGKYFFEADQAQYPHQDFDRCLEIDRFNFAVRAMVFSDYAKLIRA
jgi:2-phosphosulfolactate phosphatase